jgi:hypothetical protein
VLQGGVHVLGVPRSRWAGEDLDEEDRPADAVVPA